jgi:PAS domain S-box-containing protein
LFAALGVLTTLIIDRLHKNRDELQQSLADLQRTESQLDMIDTNVPEALFTVTETGIAEHLNLFFSKYSGREVQSLIGRGWLDVIEPSDRDALLSELSAPKGREQFERNLRIRRSDGTYRSFKCRATRSMDPQSKAAKWFGSCSDIEDETVLASALESRTRELVQLNQSLERFAYTASHDLQEPLRTICAMTELFLSRNRDELDSESSHMLAAVIKGAERMKQLISDILEFAKASNLTSSTAEVDMRVIVQAAIDNLGQAILECGAEIVVDQLPVVSSNESAMLRLVQNLIVNAIKYRADKPPKIHISAVSTDGEYVFSIQDNGIGIDPKYAGRIFEPFQRLHTRSQYEGSGLGLAACRRIVESLQGRIWVESAPGAGSTFLFTIPKHTSREGLTLGRKPPDSTPKSFGSAHSAGR